MCVSLSPNQDHTVAEKRHFAFCLCQNVADDTRQKGVPDPLFPVTLYRLKSLAGINSRAFSCFELAQDMHVHGRRSWHSYAWHQIEHSSGAFFFFFLVKNFKSGNGEGWYEDIPEQFTRGNMSHDELPEPRVSICCLLETQQAIACTPPL